MIIGWKDAAKLFGISIVVCCAVFVCILFLNYNLDIIAIKDKIVSPQGLALYKAQVSVWKVTSAVSGGCLAVTSVVLLVFYVKNYIDAHGKELGILKALGYTKLQIARQFAVFGCSVLVGGVLGFGSAHLYLPTFYRMQNAQQLLPAFSPQFHLGLAACLVAAPTIGFTLLSVFTPHSS